MEIEDEFVQDGMLLDEDLVRFKSDNSSKVLRYLKRKLLRW